MPVVICQLFRLTSRTRLWVDWCLIIWQRTSSCVVALCVVVRLFWIPIQCIPEEQGISYQRNSRATKLLKFGCLMSCSLITRTFLLQRSETLTGSFFRKEQMVSGLSNAFQVRCDDMLWHFMRKLWKHLNPLASSKILKDQPVVDLFLVSWYHGVGIAISIPKQ